MIEKFYEIATDLLCIATPEGFFQSINPAFTKTLGYSEEEMLSKPFLDFVHPNDIEKTLKQLENQIDGGPVTNFENRYRHKDGHYLNFLWKSVVNEDDGLFYAVARDITDLRKQENELSLLYETLEKYTIFTLTDEKGKIIKGSVPFEEVSGYSAQEYIGEYHSIVNSGHHPKEFFKDLWDTINSGKTWVGTIKNKAKNGKLYYVYSIISPLKNREGKIENFLSIRFDVSDHYTLKNEYDKVFSILNETNAIAKVGGWELEVDTGELTWTDETFNILEVEKKEGQKPILPEGLSLFTEEAKPIMEQALQRAIEHGEPYAYELEVVSAKGNKLWIYTNGRANYKNGKVVTLSGTIQDINQRKKAEINFEKERMINIQNSKLAALGEMSAGVAHEINNPLAIISAAVELLKRKRFEPSVLEEKLGMIERSSERIERIVNSLKKFSRSNEKQVLKKNDLSSIIKESLILAENKISKFDIKVTLDLVDKVTITCDDIEIEQVILNLINNAIDAIKEEDERWIKIILSKMNSLYLLRIIDSGKGISKEVREKIFNPFYTTKKVGEGTGLGLAISKGILESHGATITLDESSANTAFELTFPIRSED